MTAAKCSELGLANQRLIVLTSTLEYLWRDAMAMFRFTIRDVLLLTALVAMGCLWYRARFGPTERERVLTIERNAAEKELGDFRWAKLHRDDRLKGVDFWGRE